MLQEIVKKEEETQTLEAEGRIPPFMRLACSVHTHDIRNGQLQVVTEGQSGWVLHAVISSASFRRIPRSGKSYLFMMSLLINNQFARKRGIGENWLFTVRTVMLQEQVDMVAGDFNGAARRRHSGSDHRPISTIEEAFANTCIPIPPGRRNLW